MSLYWTYRLSNCIYFELRAHTLHLQKSASRELSLSLLVILTTCLGQRLLPGDSVDDSQCHESLQSPSIARRLLRIMILSEYACHIAFNRLQAIKQRLDLHALDLSENKLDRWVSHDIRLRSLSISEVTTSFGHVASCGNLFNIPFGSTLSKQLRVASNLSQACSARLNPADSARCCRRFNFRDAMSLLLADES